MHDSRAFDAKRGDPLVAEIAARQAAVVSVEQLRAAGLERGAIHHRVRRGRLHRVHHGVYVVGVRRITPRGRLWAAVLACGGVDAAAVSHVAAASAWELLPAPAEIDVVSLGESRSVAGIRVHRCRTLEPATEIRRQDDGLPLTTVARTLYDISAGILPRDLKRACHEAQYRGVLDRDEIDAVLGRHRGQPGTSQLGVVIARLTDSGPLITRSEFEERFLALVERCGLPAPRVNHRLLGYTVDFFWPDARLIVETDGFHSHSGRAAFEDDRARDAELYAAGYVVLRFTWRQLAERPDWVAAMLTAAYKPGVEQIRSGF